MIAPFLELDESAAVEAALPAVCGGAGEEGGGLCVFWTGRRPPVVGVVAFPADLGGTFRAGDGFALPGSRGVLDVFWRDPGAASFGGAVESICGAAFGVSLVPF